MKSKTLDWLPITPPRGYKVASPPYVRLHGQGASVLIERIEPTPKGLTPMVYKLNTATSRANSPSIQTTGVRYSRRGCLRKMRGGAR